MGGGSPDRGEFEWGMQPENRPETNATLFFCRQGLSAGLCRLLFLGPLVSCSGLWVPGPLSFLHSSRFIPFRLFEGTAHFNILVLGSHRPRLSLCFLQLT